MGLEPKGRGKRHAVKPRRWEVVSCPEPGYRGSWLAHGEALKLLHEGYYPEGTVLRLVHENKKVTVSVFNTLIDEEGKIYMP